MARNRDDKGSKLSSGKQPATSKAPSDKSSKHSKSKDTILKEQISSLGGTADDFDLVKGAGKAPRNEASAADPGLSKDVTSFLDGLNLNVDGPKEKRKAEKASQNSQKPVPKPKKDRAPKVESAPAPKKPSPSEAPKVVDESKGKKKADKPSKSSAQKNKKDRSTKAESITVQTESPPPEAPPKVALPTKVTLNAQSKFVFQPTSQWYTAIPALGAPSPNLPAVSPAQLSSLSERASSLHLTDIETFKTSSSSGSSASEASFLSKIIQSGTLSDRLSALTLLVQSSPLHNIRALENLKGMAERGKGQGGREESLKALRCVVDWWVGGGAPDRKLKYFRDQPLSHPSVTDQHLIVWYFEDWLKKYFFSILQVLEGLSLDPLPYVRTQDIRLIFTLLKDKPEQEQNLLRLLVNKLGDTDKALCSRASHHILQVLQAHPSMKAVVVREIIALVLRPPAPPPTTSVPADVANRRIRFNDADSSKKSATQNSSNDKKTTNIHARYYATITFNQIVLTPGDRDVSLRLIDVYFEIFRELLGEGNVDAGKDDEDAGEQDKDAEVIKDKDGRIVENRKFKGKGKDKGKAKAIEIKGAAGFTEVEDANSKLISAILTGVNRALPFAKIDATNADLMKHIDTLFMITHKSTFNISLQALVLIQHISASLPPPSAATPASSSSSATSKSITDRYYRTLYDSLHDARLASSSKQAMYLNLLFKSIKADAGNLDNERIKALVRRFVQLLVSGGSGATEFVAGGLFLLGEIFSSIPGLRDMLNKPGNPENEPYDPRKRDPQYAHASSSPLWELTPLLHHYHPAISLHARQLLSSQPLTASADLSQNTLSHFLDRFVYKNPKKITSDEAGANGIGKGKGASAMQPAASGLDGAGVKLMKGEAVASEGRVNEQRFLKKRVEDVPVDQLFFHSFFSRKQEREKAKANRGNKAADDEDDSGSDGAVESDDGEDAEDGDEGEEMDLTGDEAKQNVGVEDDDDEEEDSDAEEAEIWKVMKSSMPKVGDDDVMESSDEMPSDLDIDSDDDSDALEQESDDEDDLSLVEDSDNEDLVPLDDMAPDGLIEYDGPDSEDGGDAKDEWGGINPADTKKRKRNETSNEKRKKLRSLPTFASYEDYAKMIEDGPEDDI